MRIFILTTLLSCFLAVLSVGIAMGIMNGFDSFAYFTVFVFFNCLIPTAIGVAIFYFILWRFEFGSPLRNFIGSILLLALVFPCCLVLWAVLDVIRFNEGFKGFTFQGVVDDFRIQFSGFLSIAWVLAVAISLCTPGTQRKEMTTWLS